MNVLTVCSGIGAPEVAWRDFNWNYIASADIEAFPNAVRAHHFPDVPNWGDMTKFAEWPDATVDFLVGGTPCQSFSVAGLRKGLADPRGNLALTFLAIASKYAPRWILWENVPGVLSSEQGRDFGAFLGGLGQCGYGWAYRVLDAQYFGVPQRRRRVFVVGYLGDWRRAAAVLFERHSLSGHPAPRREKGPSVAALTANGVGTCGADDNQGQAGHLIAEDCADTLTVGANQTTGFASPSVVASTGDISHRPNAGGMGRQDYETETLIAHSLRAEGFDASEDGTGRGTQLVPVAFAQNSRDEVREIGGNIAGALAAEPGMKQQTYIAFTAKDYGADASDISPTLRSGGHDGSHANGGVMPAVAFDLRGREAGSQFEGPHDTANICAASGGSSRSYVAQSAVRRLTPIECERLQGFPDDYTLIPYRGKPAADGPRYKALGNSMAVPVMRWIGERIAMVEALQVRSEAA